MLISSINIILALGVFFFCHATAFNIPKMKAMGGKRTNQITSTTAVNMLPLDDIGSLMAASGATKTYLEVLNFNSDPIASLFSVATFFPQPFWALMILAPNRDVTKKVNGSWIPVLFCALVHFVIVSLSISQDNGTAPMALFADVFDPSGNPLQAMMGMMDFRNFVSEEWSHVLTWDLFLGRYIWLDGLERGIFTPHSVLLCNLIGPPGLLLHVLTCLLSGKVRYLAHWHMSTPYRFSNTLTTFSTAPDNPLIGSPHRSLPF